MLPLALVGVGALLVLLSSRGVHNAIMIKSKIDNKDYSVQDLPDKHEAADKMALIRQKLIKLMDSYKNEPSAMADPRVKIMVERFNPDNMCENDLNSDSTSYSENKGERIVICLRNKIPPYAFVDDNTVMFVILHEMAHLMTTTIGHTPEFWTNFKRILHDAVGCGIYTATNYSKNPVAYCGMTITDSPI